MQMAEMKTAFLLEGSAAKEGGWAWVTVAAMWGKIERSGESGRFNRIEKATHEITVRRRAELAVTSGMRMRSDRAAYLILEVRDEDPARRWLTLIVQKIEPIEGGEDGV